MKYMQEYNIINISIKIFLKERGEGMSRLMFVNSYWQVMWWGYGY